MAPTQGGAAVAVTQASQSTDDKSVVTVISREIKVVLVVYPLGVFCVEVIEVDVRAFESVAEEWYYKCGVCGASCHHKRGIMLEGRCLKHKSCGDKSDAAAARKLLWHLVLNLYVEHRRETTAIDGWHITFI